MHPSGLAELVLRQRGGMAECAGLRLSHGRDCDQLPLPIKPKAGGPSAHLILSSPKAG